MSRLSTAVDDVRPSRKRFSISGSLLPLLLLLVMLVTHTSARPQTANETAADASGNAAVVDATHVQQHSVSNSNYNDDNVVELAFDAGDDYADVDNVEWHHVKMVDGVMHEDHPIIMYKEDFVSKDYDPTQQTSHTDANNELPVHPRRKYKTIKRQNRFNRTEAGVASSSSSSSSSKQTEKYHALKPEKIYFDILPQSPDVLTDDAISNDSKPDAARIHFEIISLLDDDEQTNEATSNKKSTAELVLTQKPSKELLNKHPKKYHQQRRRRDLTAVNEKEKVAAPASLDNHKLQKRAPLYSYERYGPNSFDDYAKHLMMNYWMQKHPVAGNRWNGIDGDVPPIEVVDFDNRFGGEDNTDRVIWGVSKTGNRPSSNRPNNRVPTTRRPSQQPNFPPLFHNSNPEDADFSQFTTRRPQNNFNNNMNNNNNRQPIATKRPAVQQPQFPPLFHNSNPNDADFSAFTRPPAARTTTVRPAATRPPQSQFESSNSVSTGGEAASISQCVWAIVNCCSTRDTNIRYECFERLGCRGAFWNLNPCADNVKDNVLDFVDQQFQ